ncbi:MAG: hypothetical protein RL065_2102, partial [Bacteroidota bacterium]
SNKDIFNTANFVELSLRKVNTKYEKTFLLPYLIIWMV